jgi:hypothetical protein
VISVSPSIEARERAQRLRNLAGAWRVILGGGRWGVGGRLLGRRVLARWGAHDRLDVTRLPLLSTFTVPSLEVCTQVRLQVERKLSFNGQGRVKGRVRREMLLNLSPSSIPPLHSTHLIR